MSATAPPAARGGLPWLGHMLAYGRNPFGFVSSVAERYGDVASFVLLGRRIVLLTGKASATFYHSGDEQLDQAPAYQVMTPIFGPGVLYDAPIDRRNAQLGMLVPQLRAEARPGHVPTIAGEVGQAIAGWGDSGEVDVVDFMRGLTLNTATHCLAGPEVRYGGGGEFLSLFGDLEAGVSPVAYYFPHLPLPTFRRRDAARRRLQQIIAGIIHARAAEPTRADDLLQALSDMTYHDGTPLTETEIAGVLIGAIFAGHHTSAGTAAWVLIELLRHPDLLGAVRAEVAGVGESTLAGIHEMPVLDGVVKEVLRLHPPVIILMRQVIADLDVDGYRIPAGDLVWACPPVTHRRPDLFTDPQRFDPSRFGTGRREDRLVGAYQPFGGGRHRCAGSGFATVQLKVIVSELLRRFDFALVAPPERYVDDYRQMIVQPRSPAPIRYRART